VTASKRRGGGQDLRKAGIALIAVEKPRHEQYNFEKDNPLGGLETRTISGIQARGTAPKVVFSKKTRPDKGNMSVGSVPWKRHRAKGKVS